MNPTMLGRLDEIRAAGVLVADDASSSTSKEMADSAGAGAIPIAAPMTYRPRSSCCRCKTARYSAD